MNSEEALKIVTVTQSISSRHGKKKEAEREGWWEREIDLLENLSLLVMLN